MREYRFGAFVFQPDSGRLEEDEVTVALRPRPKELLAYLILHRDRLVTKEQILADVWDGAAVHDQVVFQAINEIRKAIDRNCIKTVPRKGYRWALPVAELDCRALWP